MNSAWHVQHVLAGLDFSAATERAAMRAGILARTRSACPPLHHFAPAMLLEDAVTEPADTVGIDLPSRQVSPGRAEEYLPCS